MTEHVLQVHNLSFQAFFNSLLLETHLGKIVRLDSTQEVIIEITGSTSLRLPLRYCSPAGRHRYRNEIWLTNSKENKPIDFANAINLILQHSFDNIDAKRKDRFINRVSESDAYIKRASAFKEQADNTESSNAFVNSEQSLIGGHSMHPAPKSCEPLTEQEQFAYLPEFSQHFAIEWFAVHRSVLAGVNVNGDLETTLWDFFQHQTNDSTLISEDDWLPYPMHPLQAKAWKESEQGLQLAQKVKPLDITSSGWTATSSSRAIYHEQSPWMLKVSFPVKLTNSLRLLTEPEAKRGIQFSKLMQHPAGIELQQRFPESTFIEEPVWCGIKDMQGDCIPLSIVCFRQNPMQVSLEDNPNDLSQESWLLASANQVDNPEKATQTGRWVCAYAEAQQLDLATAAKQWIAMFMNKVMKPICVARSDYGIVLLAHQQNLLLKIKNNQPAGVAIRDCQGMGLTDTALKRFKEVFAHEPASYFMAAQELNPYQAYYVIGNSLLNTLAAIAADCHVEEQALWQVCQYHLAKWRTERPQNDSFYDYLLTSPTLRWKRNFYCFLGDFNESTLPDPAQIYCDIANPLQKQESTSTRVYQELKDGRQCCLEDISQTEEYLAFNLIIDGQEYHSFNATVLPDKSFLLSCEQAPLNELYWWLAIEHCFGRTNAPAITHDLDHNQCAQFNAPLSHGTITYSEFIEHCPLWLRKPQQLEETQQVKASNGCTHPVRPEKPTGVIYQRYFYHLNRTLTLRVIDIERDLDCFHLWHNVPATAQVWELEGSKESHREYLTTLQNDPHQYGVIGEFDGVPFGYFEVYWTPENRLGTHYEYQDFDRGVHILVGNMSFRGSVYFDTWAKAIIQFCFIDDPRTQNIMGEPNAKNHRVITITDRVGMEKQYEFDFPNKRAALLQCKRERFFQLYAI
ncbi:GNAT family N-acetyltransferase [Paraneptunicella aestuarii]|uniref:GNAT family N-acetyltransferase n=1 Tax=Paraneptunicella aestuarii TaxID=2831148 RepID=UPI001E472EE8|nr:GNAT family N-acetyltransferase [Paraneptunicella aestuarii]UAA37370.1 GNAT family N-acetyltransferase [Paraneptunicella aestuarii]